MQESETFEQEMLTPCLRNFISAELKREIVVEKISPLRRVPSKDLTQDSVWIDEKIKLAKRIHIAVMLVVGLIFVGMMYVIFTKDIVKVSPAILFAICMFFFSAALLNERWRKNEVLPKILREMN